jgi:hypothetical protein
VRTIDARFSNRPVWVKRFQTVHRISVDVAHGLVLVSGIGTKALPSIMGFENEVERSMGRPCLQTDGRSKRTRDLTSSIVRLSGQNERGEARLSFANEPLPQRLHQSGEAQPARRKENPERVDPCREGDDRGRGGDQKGVDIVVSRTREHKRARPDQPERHRHQPCL